MSLKLWHALGILLLNSHGRYRLDMPTESNETKSEFCLYVETVRKMTDDKKSLFHAVVKMGEVMTGRFGS